MRDLHVCVFCQFFALKLPTPFLPGNVESELREGPQINYLLVPIQCQNDVASLREAAALEIRRFSSGLHSNYTESYSSSSSSSSSSSRTGCVDATRGPWPNPTGDDDEFFFGEKICAKSHSSSYQIGNWANPPQNQRLGGAPHGRLLWKCTNVHVCLLTGTFHYCSERRCNALDSDALGIGGANAGQAPTCRITSETYLQLRELQGPYGSDRFQRQRFVSNADKTLKYKSHGGPRAGAHGWGGGMESFSLAKRGFVPRWQYSAQNLKKFVTHGGDVLWCARWARSADWNLQKWLFLLFELDSIHDINIHLHQALEHLRTAIAEGASHHRITYYHVIALATLKKVFCTERIVQDGLRESMYQANALQGLLEGLVSTQRSRRRFLSKQNEHAYSTRSEVDEEKEKEKEAAEGRKESNASPSPGADDDDDDDEPLYYDTDRRVRPRLSLAAAEFNMKSVLRPCARYVTAKTLEDATIRAFVCDFSQDVVSLWYILMSRCSSVFLQAQKTKDKSAVFENFVIPALYLLARGMFMMPQSVLFQSGGDAPGSVIPVLTGCPALLGVLPPKMTDLAVLIHKGSYWRANDPKPANEQSNILHSRIEWNVTKALEERGIENPHVHVREGKEALDTANPKYAQRGRQADIHAKEAENNYGIMRQALETTIRYNNYRPQEVLVPVHDIRQLEVLYFPVLKQQHSELQARMMMMTSIHQHAPGGLLQQPYYTKQRSLAGLKRSHSSAALPMLPEKQRNLKTGRVSSDPMSRRGRRRRK